MVPMARWGRAARLLTVKSGARVLDLGCAFGYGTRLLTKRYRVDGYDLSEEYIEMARRSLPHVSFTVGTAEKLPYPDRAFAGVVMLDVLEHIPDEAEAVREVARVLQPGGELVLSVPNVGFLAPIDSLNVYVALFGASTPDPTDDPSWRLQPYHRHYSLQQLQELLNPCFRIESRYYSGLGLGEVVNLFLLVVVRRWLRAQRLFQLLQYLYFGIYILEDELAIGRGSYHLMVRARRLS